MKKIKTIGCLSALGVFGVGEIVSVSSCKANNINVSVIGINTDGKKDQKTTDTLTIATSVHINNLSVNDVKIINLKQPQRKISVSDVQSNNYAEYNIKIFGEWAESDEAVINIDKSGYVVIDSPIITLHRSATNVTLTKVDADGKTNEEDTKTLTLSTSALVDGLEPTDIKIVNKTDENRSLTANKILTWTDGDNGVFLCQFSVQGLWNENDEVSVSLEKNSYVFTGSPTTFMHKYTTTIVTLKSLIANGKTNESDTTTLTLVTDVDIKELASADVVIVNDTITGASIQVTDISGDHNGYVINILGSWNEGDIAKITVNKKGYTFSGTPTATLHKAAVYIDLLTLEANGKANEQDTDTLTLTISAGILNLSIDDIELVNTTLASRTIRVNGVAIGIGNKYKISILGDWTEGDQAQLTLKKPGYIFKNSLTTVLHAFKN